MLDTASLTFVTRLPDDRFDMWTPERPTDYRAANALGARYAGAMLTVMRDKEDPVLLGSVLRAIVTAGQHDGVEAGFYHRLALDLL